MWFKFARVNIYKWKRVPAAGQVQFTQLSINHVVSLGFSRCTLIVSCSKRFTELFYKLHTRELAR